MKYEKIKFPDGQLSVKIIESYYSNKSYHIAERINSYEDLFYVKSIVDAVRYQDPGLMLTLFIPCLFGQRSDRRFTENNSFDLKIICDFINSCNFAKVEIFDPHSDVALALINNSRKMTSSEFIARTISNLYKPETGINTCNFALVSPDAGAYKKVFEYGAKANLPVLAAVKHRDLEGKIDIKFMGDVKDKHCLIIDDLCDGGYTFTLLGKALKDRGASKVYLYVSHGYFSKGFKELSEVIDHIYCTNSVKDIDPKSEIDLVIDGKGGWVRQTEKFVTKFKII